MFNFFRKIRDRVQRILTPLLQLCHFVAEAIQIKLHGDILKNRSVVGVSQEERAYFMVDHGVLVVASKVVTFESFLIVSCTLFEDFRDGQVFW